MDDTLKPASTWEHLTGVRVIHATGWYEAKNPQVYAWPITRTEFLERAANSTAQFPLFMHDESPS